jgi:uncharacterized protein
MRIMVLAAALFAASTLSACEGRATQSEAAVALTPVTIHTAAGPKHFRVEVARTAAEQERGLMFRTALPEDGGMLFPSETPQPRSFWMKNTMIPLDLMFIRADGTIAKLAEETIPQSLEPIVCTEPVIAVLEIAGGRAAALGIAEGDRASWPGMPGAR